MEKIILFAVLLATSLSFAAPTGRGGGKDVEAEFLGIARKIVKYLDGENMQQFPEVDFTAFKAKVESLTVDNIQVEYVVCLNSKAVEGQCINDEEKDAVNDPKTGIIEVSASRWQPYNLRTVRLVFHEVLGLMRNKADKDYILSNRLFDMVSKERQGRLSNYDMSARSLSCGDQHPVPFYGDVPKVKYMNSFFVNMIYDNCHYELAEQKVNFYDFTEEDFGKQFPGKQYYAHCVDHQRTPDFFVVIYKSEGMYFAETMDFVLSFGPDHELLGSEFIYHDDPVSCVDSGRRNNFSESRRWSEL